MIGRVALALLSLCCAVPAAAQGLFGPRAADIPMGSMDEKDRARVALVRYADCLVHARTRMVRHALDLPPGPLADKEFAALSTDACLSAGQLRFPASLLRGPLFIALYRRNFPGVAPALAPAPIDFAKVSHLAADDPQIPTFVAFRVIGDCVARADPAAAREVVMASPVSPAEKAAFAPLMPRLVACLPGGQRFVFNKMILAGLLAEVMVREAPPAGAEQASVTMTRGRGEP